MKKSDITFLGNCPVCAAAYRQECASVVEKQGDALTFHVDCKECASSALLTVYSGLKGFVTTVGVPTDLAKADLARVKRSKRLTSDDVLELHTFLESKKTDGKDDKTPTRS